MAPTHLLSPRRLAASGAVAATILAVAACGSTDNGTSSSSSGGPGAGGGPTVTAVDYSFNPSSVSVSGGQVTVTFQNNGNTQHSLTLDNGGGEVIAAPGQSATLTFTAPQSGTLTFHCKFHPTQMKGSFTVGSGGAGGASSSSSSSSSGGGYGY